MVTRSMTQMHDGMTMPMAIAAAFIFLAGSKPGESCGMQAKCINFSKTIN
jgi:hypothetical protein